MRENIYYRQKVTFELFWIQILTFMISSTQGFEKISFLILINSNVTFSLSPSGLYELYDFFNAGFRKKTLILILVNSNVINRINVYNKNMTINDKLTYLHWKCAYANKTFWIF